MHARTHTEIYNSTSLKSTEQSNFILCGKTFIQAMEQIHKRTLIYATWSIPSGWQSFFSGALKH